jgi:hypothetical protein
MAAKLLYPTRGPTVCIVRPTAMFVNCLFTTEITQYLITPLTKINWDGKPSGYAELPDDLIFN